MGELAASGARDYLEQKAFTVAQGRRALFLAHLTLLHLAPPRFVTIAAEAGFQGVSLHLTTPAIADPGAVSYPMLGSGSVMMRETLARIHDSGIAVHDIQVIRLTPDVHISEFLPMLDAGGRLGASYVIVVSDDENESRNAQHIAELGNLCVDFGLRVAVEFMAYSGIKNIQQALRVISASGDSGAVILLDALHLARSGGTAADVMQIDRGLIPYLQICDGLAAPFPEPQGGLRWEARRERLVPGWGQLPLEDLLSMLPPDLPLSVETPSETLRMSFDDSTIAEIAIDATRDLCNRVMTARARRGE